MKVKITQTYPIRYQGLLYNHGSELDIDDKIAAWLIDNERAVEIKGSGLTPEELAAKEAERKAAIVKAIQQLQTANPNEVPSCTKIKERSGYAIKVDERDSLIAEMKNEKQE